MGSGTYCSKIDGFPGTHGTHTNADYVEDNTLRFILRLCEKMKNFQAKMSPSATETSYVDPEAGDHEIFSDIRI